MASLLSTCPTNPRGHLRPRSKYDQYTRWPILIPLHFVNAQYVPTSPAKVPIRRSQRVLRSGIDLQDLVARFRRRGTFEPDPKGRGNPSPVDVEVLPTVLNERPDAITAELTSI